MTTPRAAATRLIDARAFWDILREMLSTTTVLTTVALAALIVALRALLLAGFMVWRGTWRPAAK